MSLDLAAFGRMLELARVRAELDPELELDRRELLDSATLQRELGVPGNRIGVPLGQAVPVAVYADFSERMATAPVEARGYASLQNTPAAAQWARVDLLCGAHGGLIVERIYIGPGTGPTTSPIVVSRVTPTAVGTAQATLAVGGQDIASTVHADDVGAAPSGVELAQLREYVVPWFVRPGEVLRFVHSNQNERLDIELSWRELEA